jgi:hypothetical protein
MSDFYGQVRQMPCPDCGYPVQPDRDQLCPNCGYPLLFLRKSSAENEAKPQSIPRSPREQDDMTGLRAQPVPQPRVETRQFQPGRYGVAAPGQVQCRSCGYLNDPGRVRCERCGFELRNARPRGTVLGPPVVAPAPAKGGWSWLLLVLIILAVVAVVVLGLVLLRVYLA